MHVAPFAGAWIEIRYFLNFRRFTRVAPFAGAWIEIKDTSEVLSGLKSLPSRERGLKYNKIISRKCENEVAPFAGAWIEIKDTSEVLSGLKVAPFAGAWIEMLKICS